MALMLAEAMRLSHYLRGNCGAAARCAILATNSLNQRSHVMTARRILQFNAVTTLACAIAMIAGRKVLYPWFGLDSPTVIDGLAVAFVAYAGAMFSASRRRPVERRALMPFAIADWTWVAASGLVLLLYWNQVAPAGRLLLIVVGVAVDVFATVQFRVARSPLARAASAAESLS